MIPHRCSVPGCSGGDRHQLLAAIHRNVQRFGWGVMGVGGETPHTPVWTYTVAASRTPWGHEAIIVGQDPRWSQTLLNDLVRAANAGVDVLDRDALVEALGLAGPFVQAMPVHPDHLGGEWFAACRAYLGAGVPSAYQLALADANGRFPWDAGCEMAPVACLWDPPAPARSTLFGRQR